MNSGYLPNYSSVNPLKLRGQFLFLGECYGAEARMQTIRRILVRSCC